MNTVEHDAQIVEQVLAGRRAEFGQLIHRYETFVRAIALAHISAVIDLDDVVQDSFIAAYTRLDSLRDRRRFAPWLASIARNAAISCVRKEQREQELRDAMKRQPQQAASAGSRQELHQVLHRELAGLEPGQREMLLLYYFRGMSTRALAEALNISVENAKKRLQRARAALGERMEAQMAAQRGAFQADERRLQQITRAVLCVPVAWKFSATTGAAATLAGLWESGVAMIGTAAVLVLVAAVTVWQAPQAMRADPVVEVGTEAAATEPALDHDLLLLEDAFAADQGPLLFAGSEQEQVKLSFYLLGADEKFGHAQPQNEAMQELVALLKTRHDVPDMHLVQEFSVRCRAGEAVQYALFMDTERGYIYGSHGPFSLAPGEAPPALDVRIPPMDALAWAKYTVLVEEVSFAPSLVKVAGLRWGVEVAVVEEAAGDVSRVTIGQDHPALMLRPGTMMPLGPGEAPDGPGGDAARRYAETHRIFLVVRASVEDVDIEARAEGPELPDSRMHAEPDPRAQAAMREIEEKLARVESYSYAFEVTGWPREEEAGTNMREEGVFRRPQQSLAVTTPVGEPPPELEGVRTTVYVDESDWWAHYHRPAGQSMLRRYDVRELERHGIRPEQYGQAFTFAYPFAISDRDSLRLESEDDAHWVFRGKPARHAAGQYEAITLTIRKEDGILQEMTLVTRGGNSGVRVTLLQIELNPTLGEAAFAFTPPEGVEVVDGTAGIIEEQAQR